MYDGSRWSLVIFVKYIYASILYVLPLTLFFFGRKIIIWVKLKMPCALWCARNRSKTHAHVGRHQAHVCHGNVAHHRRPLIGHYATWFLGKGEDPGVVFSTVMIPPNVLMIRKCITSVKLNLKTEK